MNCDTISPDAMTVNNGHDSHELWPCDHQSVVGATFSIAVTPLRELSSAVAVFADTSSMTQKSVRLCQNPEICAGHVCGLVPGNRATERPGLAWQKGSGGWLPHQAATQERWPFLHAGLGIWCLSLEHWLSSCETEIMTDFCLYFSIQWIVWFVSLLFFHCYIPLMRGVFVYCLFLFCFSAEYWCVVCTICSHSLWFCWKMQKISTL